MELEEIYRNHKSLVYNLALQYIQNAEDAEEITQDVFVSIHFSVSKFNEQSKVATWIYRITINKSLDFIKAKNRKKRLGIFTSLFYDNSNELKNDLAVFNHPGVLLESKEELEKIFKHINQLPKNQKTVIILNKIEQKTIQETAEIMNASYKATESLIQRAKNNLLKNSLVNPQKCFINLSNTHFRI